MNHRCSGRASSFSVGRGEWWSTPTSPVPPVPRRSATWEIRRLRNLKFRRKRSTRFEAQPGVALAAFVLETETKIQVDPAIECLGVRVSTKAANVRLVERNAEARG